jgi:hypothetical protein
MESVCALEAIGPGNKNAALSDAALGVLVFVGEYIDDNFIMGVFLASRRVAKRSSR